MFPPPRCEGYLPLDSDASDNQIEWVFMQEQRDGAECLLNQWSQTLNVAEQNYDTTPGKSLAVKRVIVLLSFFLEEQRFTLRTDHT